VTTVQDVLPHLREELIFVNSGATAEQVRTLMIVNGISRVPVIDGADGPFRGRTCRGIVRMRTFFERQPGQCFPQRAKELMDAPPPEIGVDAPLFDAIKSLRGHPEVLVRDAEGFLSRMLTPRGLADWWSAYSRPFLALEEFEKVLRDVLRSFEGDQLTRAVDVARVEELSPRDYSTAVQAFWSELSAFRDLDPGEVNRVLVSFAEQRNKLMHFRLDDKSTMEPHLRRFGKLQARICDAMSGSSSGNGAQE
jgi:CBS domain-containing protein